MTRPRKAALFLGLALLGLIALASLSALLVVRTDWFHEQVRQRIVSEVEDATGGRPEIGSFRFDWRTLQAEVGSFILHGTEGPGEPPLLQAQSVQVGLKIFSVLHRDINIALLRLVKPRLHIAVYEDGRTNVPRPKVTRRHSKNPIEQIVDLAIRKFSIEDGLLEFSSKTVPLNVRGERLKARFFYETSNPRYTGRLSLRQLQLQSGAALPFAFDVDSSVVLAGDRIEISGTRLSMEQSSAEIAGAIENLPAPRGEFSFDAGLSLRELGGLIRLPVAREGGLKLTGKASFNSASEYQVEARVTGTGLAVEHGGARVRNVRLASDLSMDPGRLQLRPLSISALGGNFSGKAEINNFRRFSLDGELRNLLVQELNRLRNLPATSWRGSVSGIVSAEAELADYRPLGAKVHGRLAIAASSGDLPLQGSFDLMFDQSAGVIELGDSYLATPSSRLEFYGTLEHNLRVQLESKDLNDFLPVATLFGGTAPQSLPLALDNGTAKFSGRVTGKLQDPHLSGRATLKNFVFQGRRFDGLATDLAISATGAHARGVSLERDDALVRGELRVGLRDWRPYPAGSLAGSFDLRGIDVERLLAETGRQLPLGGTLSGAVAFANTVGAPAVSGSLVVHRAVAYEERLDRVRTEFAYSDSSLKVRDLQVEAGEARVQGQGVFTHLADSWQNGALRFELSGKDVSLSQVRVIAGLPTGIEGAIEATASGEAVIAASRPRVTRLQGRLSLSRLALGGKPAGKLMWTADTKAGVLTINTEGEVAGAGISGRAACRLEATYPVNGEVQFTRLALSSLRAWWTPAPKGKALPLEAFAEGKVAFSGLGLDRNTWKGHVEIPALEITPQQRASEAEAFTLRNAGPVAMEIDPQALRIENVRLVGTGTNLQASGRVSFKTNDTFQIIVLGAVNLSVLHNFEPNLTASGDSTVDATIRGPLAKPEVNGRLAFKNASFYLSEIPNGIDKASGVILFSRDRATIEKVSAETGGGRLTFGGFVGYGGEQVTYRLRAAAEQVRVRYPKGVSTSFDASLNLTGTSTRSLLSGTVTVLRSGVNPRVDLAGLLARSSRPMVTAATQNELLRGMQFDVHVQTSPDARFETTLTRDIQPEADLRLRGTPYKPVLLGRVSVAQGEINFLGSRYTINRGDISFLNPAKLEPVLNLDLETRVRGIDVTLTFSGPLNKLNTTYRSDPPLQPNEIIALLAVGRAPSSGPTLAARQSEHDQSWQQIGASTLVGQALAAPVAGRLQRFFGVSRIKIDPNLTGVENNPQAQLTLEQQVSRDITFTYITNLSQGQEQVVRVEWNVSREWSVLAVREENGLFGVDFLFRKQFK